MTEQRRRGARLSLAILMIAVLFLTGCATTPPKQIQPLSGTQAPDPVATEDPGTQAATSQTEKETGEPVVAQTPAPLPGVVSRVELFFSGMPSLMGFADAPKTTVYENAMDALSACISLCWPQATSTYYRYGADIPKTAMSLTKERLLSSIGEPYFYLDTALFKLPARVKRENAPLTTEAENMNEPVSGFYETLGISSPSAQSGLTGTPVAIDARDPDAFTLIVTDLSELRTDDGTLLATLSDSISAGRSVGVAAVMSEFAGLIPGIGASETAFVWGAPPTGTLDYRLDYGDYQVGVSIDPAQRETSARPFYVLCIGDSTSVHTYLAALSDRLTRELSASGTFKLRTAVYGGGYVPTGYSLEGNMRFLGGQGVTALPDAKAPAGVSLVELKASQQERYLSWEVDFRAHPQDPRGTALTAEDFVFATTAISEAGETVLPDLSWSIAGIQGDLVTLKLTLKLPTGILPAGSYSLELAGSLASPPELPGSAWLDEFGIDADGEQIYEMERGTRPFDGSKTLFLSRLIDTLGKFSQGRLGAAPLGTIILALTVYA